MKLRPWQRSCLKVALDRYHSGKRHNLITATPGAGKTFLAAVIAKELFEKSLIDYVICITPSVDVANSFRTELSTVTGQRMDGRFGSFGETITYQSLAFLNQDFWDVLDQYRVMVIRDEIHHCGGISSEQANTWGLSILKNIKDKAAYSLSLSGTPWRSDGLPLTLCSYCDEAGMLESNYTYSLSQAITDGVCRIPQIISIDNSNLRYEIPGGESKEFSCMSDLLGTNVSFQQLLDNETLVSYMLMQANAKLIELRSTNPSAGGLIVASSVVHAYQISELLKKYCGQDAIIITSRDKQASRALNRFKQSRDPWVVSVGMISEGTNVPRLQLCCYLSRIRTELYFRQVMGRVIRVTSKCNGQATLYTFAEPNLIRYSKRLNEDIPTENILINLDSGEDNPETVSISPDLLNEQDQFPNELATKGTLSLGINEEEGSDLLKIDEGYGLKDRIIGELSISGQFLEQLIALKPSQNQTCPL